MRLLVANPNMSEVMTERLTDVAVAAAAANTEIIPATASRGFPYISSRAEAQISGGIALEMIAARMGSIDAAIIAAFGDPGLKAARELFDIPIVGMAEAAIVAANMLGERFAIVTFTPAMTSWFTEQVHASGLAGRFAGCRTPDQGGADAATAGDAMQEELLRLSRLAATQDGADVVILGGAPLAGLAAVLQDKVPAVLVDPISAAVKMAEALAVLAPHGAAFGRFARPAAKSSEGLNSELAAWIGRMESDPEGIQS